MSGSRKTKCQGHSDSAKKQADLPSENQGPRPLRSAQRLRPSSLAMQHVQPAVGRTHALAAHCLSFGSPSSAAVWLAAAALCTACSFTPRVAPVTAWGMFPAALAAWLAAHTDQGCAAQLKLSLEACFCFTFVAAQAAASIIAVFGILQGPGVPPLAGHIALVPICIALWLVLALPFALHVVFARRCVVMQRSAAGGLSVAPILQIPRLATGASRGARCVDCRVDSHRRAKSNWCICQSCGDPGAKPSCAVGWRSWRRRNCVRAGVARYSSVVRAAASLLHRMSESYSPRNPPFAAWSRRAF